LRIQVARRLFPYLQGLFAVLVVADWTHFRTVVTGGSLPKSSHAGRRSGGLPTPLLPLDGVAQARVWGGGPPDLMLSLAVIDGGRGGGYFRMRLMY
jgi:hypothetical protein